MVTASIILLGIVLFICCWFLFGGALVLSPLLIVRTNGKLVEELV